MDLNKISSLIKKKRKSLGMTQTELANKLFVTEKAVSRWETGRGTPDISLLIPLSKELNIDVSELLNGEENNIEKVIEYNEKAKKYKYNFQFKLIILFYILSILTFLFYLKFEYNPNIEINYFIRLSIIVIASLFIFIGNKIYSNNYVEKIEDKNKIKKLSQTIIFIYYIILIFNMVFFARYNVVNNYNLIPFKSISNILKNGNTYSIIINIFGNLFVFMPLEYFLIELFKIRKISLNFIISFLIILLIELFQFVFKVGVLDIDDLILCTLGMMILRFSDSSLISLIFCSIAIGISIKEQLIIMLISFLPFLIFLLITIFSYYHKEKYKIVIRVITIILSILLIGYYFIATFLCIILQSLNPVINPNYYNYYIQTSNLKEKFPNKIPNNAENIKFIYSIGIFQGGTIYSLYYIDNKMTDEIFMKKYKNKAMWIGHIDEYTDKKGLLSGVFNNTPAHDKNTNDYTIYLMDGDFDNSGYCNHGNYIIAAFNEKTHEVIFSSEQW